MIPLAALVTRRLSLPTSDAASRAVSTDRRLAKRKNATATLKTVRIVRLLFRPMLARTRRAYLMS